MKILQVHNYYRQSGGEDVVVQAEKKLLKIHGHAVIPYYKHNVDLDDSHPVRMAIDTIWNRRIQDEFNAVLVEHKPDVVHCHNIFPMISPSIYGLCRKHSVPVVQTLHNYRWLCANGYLLYRDRVCAHCRRHKWSPLPIAWRCYRDSAGATAVQLASHWFHRARKTLFKNVDAFIVLTEFARKLFAEHALPAERIHVKPNFCLDPMATASDDKTILSTLSHDIPTSKPLFLYVGRLSPEKGVSVMVEAWRLTQIDAALLVVGDGPMMPWVRENARMDARIRVFGRQDPDTVHALMRTAAAVIVPSICYESMPTAIIEAFANGTAVISSRHGAMAEMVDDPQNGLFMEPGNQPSLASQIAKLCTEPELAARLGKFARNTYLKHYTPVSNYASLMKIYQKVLTK